MSTISSATAAFAGNFDIQVGRPIDARTKQATLADLTDKNSWVAKDGNVYLYKGLEVYIASENCKYRLIVDPVGKDAANCFVASAWQKLEDKGAAGVKGDTGATGATGASIESVEATDVTGGKKISIKIEGNDTPTEFTILNGAAGEKGADGIGITDITESGETGSGAARTITVTLSDNSSKTFTVYNGAKGEQGVQGEKGATGEGFSIYKTYESVVAMNADIANVAEGKFVMITSTVEDEDNAKLYVRAKENFTFITDLSGAQGIQGPKGDPGAAGATGATGEKGADGKSITGVTATDNETGTGKVITISVDGAADSTFEILNGVAGATGATGATGEKGDKGDSPVVTYTTTATGTLTKVGEISIDGTKTPIEIPEVEGTYETEVTGTTMEVGGIYNMDASDLKGKSFTEVLDMLLFPTYAPQWTDATATINVTVSNPVAIFSTVPEAKVSTSVATASTPSYTAHGGAAGTYTINAPTFDTVGTKTWSTSVTFAKGTDIVKDSKNANTNKSAGNKTTLLSKASINGNFVAGTDAGTFVINEITKTPSKSTTVVYPVYVSTNSGSTVAYADKTIAANEVVDIAYNETNAQHGVAIEVPSTFTNVTIIPKDLQGKYVASNALTLRTEKIKKTINSHNLEYTRYTHDTDTLAGDGTYKFTFTRANSHNDWSEA